MNKLIIALFCLFAFASLASANGYNGYNNSDYGHDKTHEVYNFYKVYKNYRTYSYEDQLPQDEFYRYSTSQIYYGFNASQVTINYYTINDNFFYSSDRTSSRSWNSTDTRSEYVSWNDTTITENWIRIDNDEDYSWGYNNTTTHNLTHQIYNIYRVSKSYRTYGYDYASLPEDYTYRYTETETLYGFNYSAIIFNYIFVNDMFLYEAGSTRSTTRNNTDTRTSFISWNDTNVTENYIEIYNDEYYSFNYSSTKNQTNSSSPNMTHEIYNHYTVYNSYTTRGWDSVPSNDSYSYTNCYTLYGFNMSEVSFNFYTIFNTNHYNSMYADSRSYNYSNHYFSYHSWNNTNVTSNYYTIYNDEYYPWMYNNESNHTTNNSQKTHEFYNYYNIHTTYTKYNPYASQSNNTYNYSSTHTTYYDFNKTDVTKTTYTFYNNYFYKNNFTKDSFNISNTNNNSPKNNTSNAPSSKNTEVYNIYNFISNFFKFDSIDYSVFPKNSSSNFNDSYTAYYQHNNTEITFNYFYLLENSYYAYTLTGVNPIKPNNTNTNTNTNTNNNTKNPNPWGDNTKGGEIWGRDLPSWNDPTKGGDIWKRDLNSGSKTPGFVAW